MREYLRAIHAYITVTKIQLLKKKTFFTLNCQLFVCPPLRLIILRACETWQTCCYYTSIKVLNLQGSLFTSKAIFPQLKTCSVLPTPQ